ncbi:MAG: hypothetical protein ACE5JX_14075 [Acidobacteriota bacterium]
MQPKTNNGILIASPMRKEAAALKGLLEGTYEVVGTGLGIDRTVPFLLKRFRLERPSLLIFSGSANSLDVGLEMGDIVFPRNWCIQQGPCFESDRQLIDSLVERGWNIGGMGLTVPHSLLSPRQRGALYQSTGACIYDTVTAAVLRLAETSSVPCLTPKIVATTARSGIMTFWTRLENHLEPLAEYLLRLVEDWRRQGPGGHASPEPFSGLLD